MNPNDMSVADNWSGSSCGGTSTSDDSALLSGAELIFPSSTASNPPMDDYASLTIDDLLFNGSTGTPFYLMTSSSSNLLTIDPISNSSVGIADNTGSNVTVQVNIALSESQSFTTATGASLEMAGVISNGSSQDALTATGSGTLVLSGANTYSGGTTVSAPVQVKNSLALGTGAVTVTAPSSSLSGDNLILYNQGSPLVVSNPLTFTGSTNTLEDVTSDTWSGPITLAAGAGVVDSLQSDTGSTFTVSGVISGGSSGSILDLGSGNGTLVLSSSNTYLGATDMESEPVIEEATNALPVTTTLSMNSGGLNLNGYNQTLASINDFGPITSSRGTPTLTVTLPNGLTDYFPGTLTGSLGLTVDGPSGTFQLAGNDTYLGPTNVIAGTLEDSVSNALPGTTVLDVASGGTYDLNGYSQQVGAISNDSGTITDSGSSAILTVGALSANDQVAETLSGNLALTVDAGNYKLTLSGSSSNSGATTVSSGTLEVTGTLSQSAVTVSNGATLEGTGTVNGITANAGTVLDPGSSSTHLGTLTSSSGASLAGSTLNIELGGTASGSFSQLNVGAGGVNVSGTALTLSCSSFAPVPSDSFGIVENGQGGAIVGTFAGLSQGSIFTACGQTFQVSYIGGLSGHDVVITDVAAPNAPSGVTATGGNASATVSFTAPSDNGSPITGYTVTATDSTNSANGGETATGTSSPITVSGLTNGDSYTFTVTATNGVGTSSAGGPSNPVTPTSATAPNAPSPPRHLRPHLRHRVRLARPAALRRVRQERRAPPMTTLRWSLPELVPSPWHNTPRTQLEYQASPLLGSTSMSRPLRETPLRR